MLGKKCIIANTTEDYRYGKRIIARDYCFEFHLKKEYFYPLPYPFTHYIIWIVRSIVLISRFRKLPVHTSAEILFRYLFLINIPNNI